MKQTSPDVNQILLHGRAVQPPALSHRNHDVDFFTVPEALKRKGDQKAYRRYLRNSLKGRLG